MSDMNNQTNKPSKNPIKRFMDPNFQIVKRAKWFSIAPAIIIFAGLMVVLIFNFNLGLDFTGGRIVNITGFETNEFAQVRQIVTQEMNDAGITGLHIQQEERVEGGTIMAIRFPNPAVLNDKSGLEITAFFESLQDTINARLTTETTLISSHIEIGEAESISASASQERMLNVFMAVTLALLGIFFYMLFRFKVNSGIAAIVGLFHDVLIMASLVAIFQIQINFIFVAAMITIIAYSLNNTLVLFDRVRSKERQVETRLTPEQIMDASIKETFVRQLATTVSTIIPVVILAILGVPLIREFAIPIVFGLVAGFYSTIFLTSALYVRFENARIRKAKLTTRTQNS